jgi:branched-chain amino acid transport system ATP-binding protein
MMEKTNRDIILEARDVHMAFGGLVVFDCLNFALGRGERHAIIGPNGAGKTTFVSLVTGLLTPKAGNIYFNDSAITGLSPQDRVKKGIVRTFQINTLFKGLNPLESAVLALCERDGRTGVSLRSIGREATLIDEATDLLAKFGLRDDALTVTDTLPYGKQRLLEVALAFALKPQVLLLDEPAAGLSTQQGHELFTQLLALLEDTTVLFIEHDMNIVFRYADIISVFAGGALVVQDVPEKVRVDPRVREVYLGT